MEATIFLSVFMAFLLGGMMLALVLGYQSGEARRAIEERQQKSEARPVPVALGDPGLFADLDPRVAASTLAVFDDALLARVERHVREEQAFVTQFVNQPSIGSLYRQREVSLRAN